MNDDQRLEPITRYVTQQLWAAYLKAIEDMIGGGVSTDDSFRIAMSVAGGLYAYACCRFLRHDGDPIADQVMAEQRQRYRDLAAKMAGPAEGEA